MPPQALAAIATLLSVVPHGNRIELQLDRGGAELVWVSPSTFRFRRVLEVRLPPDAGSIDQQHRVSADLHWNFDRIASGAGAVIDNCALESTQAIE